MKTLQFLASATGLCLLLAAAGCGFGAPDVEPGESIQAYRLASVDGGEVDLGALRGKVVLMDFWATWCGPCHQQAKILDELYDDVRDEGVEFLAVNVGEDLGTVSAFVERDPFPYPVVLDGDTASIDLGVAVLPTIIVLDGEGRVAFSKAGVTSARRLRKEIRKALG